MTSFSDCGGDMRDEPSLHDPLLTDFLSELKSWGTGPAPMPSGALASLLDDADHLAPVPAPASRRKKMLVPKLAALGMAAKVALGFGVAAAAVTTAGMAGALPGPAQNTVAAVVSALSPLDLPGAAGDVADHVTSDVTTDVTTDTTLPRDDDVTGDDPVEGEAPANHGACVSAIAHDKSVSGREHGKAVSEVARSDCGKTGDDTTTSSTTSTSTTSTIPGDETEEISGSSGPNSNSGHGNGGNQGNGNGGSGSGKKK